jgi:hypothetical protein
VAQPIFLFSPTNQMGEIWFGLTLAKEVEVCWQEVTGTEWRKMIYEQQGEYWEDNVNHWQKLPKQLEEEW